MIKIVYSETEDRVLGEANFVLSEEATTTEILATLIRVMNLASFTDAQFDQVINEARQHLANENLKYDTLAEVIKDCAYAE